MKIVHRRGFLLSASAATVILLVVSVLYVQHYEALPNSSAQQSPRTYSTTGVVIPMFTNYSTIEVGEIIGAKQANPSVPFLVVANPTGGPGPEYNATYGSALRSLQEAGITVLGYVPTGWGDRSIAAVESDVLTFHNWYGIDGIYLDQMYNLEFSGNGAFMPQYYSTLSDYVRSLGMSEVFGNSGADVPYYFVGTVSTIGDFENAHLPLLSALGGWHIDVPKTNFAFFAYNVSSVDPYYVAAVSNYVGYLYITNGERPFPYGGLPPYFGQVVSELGSLVPVTVKTSVPNGTLVSQGFNVTVTQPDGLNNTAQSPSTFDVIVGSTVTVSLRNSSGYVFDHWGDGGKDPTIQLTPTGPMTLVAYSSTSQTNASVVTVHTMETSGIPVTGMFTTASQDGVIVASGYTPFTFVATRGANYSIAIANYEGYSFASWTNASGSVNGTSIVIQADHDLLLNAYVQNVSSTNSRVGS